MPPLIFSLYPTWFRWKHAGRLKVYQRVLLYIPHGSDESRLSASRSNRDKNFISHMVQMKELKIKPFISVVLTLYPTWFRWKETLVTVASHIKSLYIPHGSDESFSNASSKDEALTLYIPHGSDESKVVFRWDCLALFFFISHMVQMKVVLSC